MQTGAATFQSGSRTIFSYDGRSTLLILRSTGESREKDANTLVELSIMKAAPLLQELNAKGN
jgi:hypothetical protein